MLSRLRGVVGADSLPRLSELLVFRLPNASEAALSTSSLPVGRLAAAFCVVRIDAGPSWVPLAAPPVAVVAAAVGVAAESAAAAADDDGKSVLLGTSQIGIWVLAIVVLPLLMYNLTSNNCMANMGIRAFKSNKTILLWFDQTSGKASGKMARHRVKTLMLGGRRGLGMPHC